MKAPKINIDSENNVIVICPQCQTEIFVGKNSYEISTKPLIIKCSCSNQFNIILEYRKNYRRKTDLIGEYFYENIKHKISINSLSYDGIGFKTSTRHNLTIGDTIEIDFFLNEYKKLKLITTAEVKHIKDDFIGCQFINFDEENREKLDTYFMNNFEDLD